MRTLLRALFITIGILGVSLTPQPAASQTTIADLIAQYPEGGPGLRAAIANYLEQFPDQAPAVIAAALTANPAQQLAIGAGFADAALYFAKIGTAFAMAAQAKLLSAIEAAADTQLAAAFDATFRSGSSQTLFTTIQNLLGTTAPIAGCSGNVHCVSQ